jgi:hypothetical protein
VSFFNVNYLNMYRKCFVQTNGFIYQTSLSGGSFTRFYRVSGVFSEAGPLQFTGCPSLPSSSPTAHQMGCPLRQQYTARQARSLPGSHRFPYREKGTGYLRHPELGLIAELKADTGVVVPLMHPTGSSEQEIPASEYRSVPAVLK